MKSNGRFTLMTLGEFPGWLKKQAVARKIALIQEHHTYEPHYALFTGANHFPLLDSMRRFHILELGFRDIGQHFTTFPDGTIATGRPLNLDPAGIAGANANAVCIENLGNFDAGRDTMKPEHRATIIGLTAALARALAVPVDTNHIVYHHWYDASGKRTGEAGAVKSCPGTAFFGGNKVADCSRGFLPLVKAQLGRVEEPRPPQPAVALMAGEVTADSLNVRQGPSAQDAVLYSLARGVPVAGYEARGAWWRIHPAKQQWLNSKYLEKIA